jgi:hypothetical protein
MFYATLEGPLLLPLFGWLVYYQIVQACACQSTARVTSLYDYQYLR